MSVSFLENKEVKELLDNAQVYQKSAKTWLRQPLPSELGKELITYVKDGDGYRKESSNTVGENIVARNSSVLGKDEKGNDVYNEWLVPVETANKNYGVEVISNLSSEDFTAHKKKATLKAIELTTEVMKKLGVDGDKLEIKVSWSPEPMIAHVGDFLADGGYSISKSDMKDYEQVFQMDKKKVLENIDSVRGNQDKKETFFKPS